MVSYFKKLDFTQNNSIYFFSNPMDHSDPCLYQQSVNHKHVPRPVARHSLQPMGATARSRQSHEAWLKPRHSAGDAREKFNYSQHWLIQVSIQNMN